VKYAHFADVHIGSWKEQKLQDASSHAFEKACDLCVTQDVDFILISGDIFNTSLPPIDKLRFVVRKLRKLRERHIPVYIIAGSHDFSPSGKTMLDVLDEARLVTNVTRGTVKDGMLHLQFTTDAKTGAKITGLVGKKGMLDRRYYESLDCASLEEEQGYRIFLFHTALSELKPKELDRMEASPISLLPRGFDYYAGGHVHIVKQFSMDGYRMVTYPGALFPANFRELEQFGHGGIFIVESDGQGNDTHTWHPIKLYEVVSLKLDCNHKLPADVERGIRAWAKQHEGSLPGAIVTLRLEGRIREGRISDIGFAALAQEMLDRGAHAVLRNTAKLVSSEFEGVAVREGTTQEMEDALIHEHAGQIPFAGMDAATQAGLCHDLLRGLDIEREEGEKVSEFEARLIQNASSVIDARNLL